MWTSERLLEGNNRHNSGAPNLLLLAEWLHWLNVSSTNYRVKLFDGLGLSTKRKTDFAISNPTISICSIAVLLLHLRLVFKVLTVDHGCPSKHSRVIQLGRHVEVPAGEEHCSANLAGFAVDQKP